MGISLVPLSVPNFRPSTSVHLTSAKKGNLQGALLLSATAAYVVIPLAWTCSIKASGCSTLALYTVILPRMPISIPAVQLASHSRQLACIELQPSCHFDVQSRTQDRYEDRCLHLPRPCKQGLPSDRDELESLIVFGVVLAIYLLEGRGRDIHVLLAHKVHRECPDLKVILGLKVRQVPQGYLVLRVYLGLRDSPVRKALLVLQDLKVCLDVTGGTVLLEKMGEMARLEGMDETGRRALRAIAAFRERKVNRARQAHQVKTVCQVRLDRGVTRVTKVNKARRVIEVIGVIEVIEGHRGIKVPQVTEEYRVRGENKECRVYKGYRDYIAYMESRPKNITPAVTTPPPYMTQEQKW
ncbi:hypothetical protein J7T55_010436 [Diaporthe amygdali]|uniref:uncharacterized protein n=1 Tax=Phomopsis amygdali TaxID=1214568 RepID=UPI0022FDC255|nr:uncharacterized protein J7T55_010436 [Diaporthe amygdali]KAJ0115613.1 hypothetical protein J7T55_010436 [Diaporthe amygdali]